MAENEAADLSYEAFPDRGPVDLTNNAFEFRPMPVGLEVKIQTYQIAWKQMFLRKSSEIQTICFQLISEHSQIADQRIWWATLSDFDPCLLV